MSDRHWHGVVLCQSGWMIHGKIVSTRMPNKYRLIIGKQREFSEFRLRNHEMHTHSHQLYFNFCGAPCKMIGIQGAGMGTSFPIREQRLTVSKIPQVGVCGQAIAFPIDEPEI
ncbi:hypothetical protein CIHG_08148 [Coccidioides immitis H538.4]|uniref:Uncharacterized protein n=2 Tax=Coccidioides immitis TaxID=5501 RepID=A0A0J8S1T7_COCIT|nr:hypothetical protein CIRG_02069 [Coccidioides immitis RMSCC 2394]KMU90339.1 hypothetical protein CIHG_08148 [Coccidioides immitis H538.4]